MSKKIKRRGKKFVASLCIISLVFMFAGVNVNRAKAAALSTTQDVITSSVPSATVQHQFVFTSATALTTDAGASADANFFFQLPTSGTDPFTIGALAAGDITVTCTACSSSVFAVTAVTLADNDSDAKNDNIKVAVNETGQDSTPVPIGSVITLTIDNAPGIASPSKVLGVGTADVYQITVETREDTGDTAVDTGTAMVAIIEGVTVSVTIDESLSFVLAEETAANCPATLPGTDKSDDTGHTDTAITFGSLSSGNAFNHSCHLATVSTNAGTGYTTTVEKTQPLTHTDLTTTIADGDCNAGTCTASSSGLWTTTSENGFGYCLQDTSGNPALTTDSTDDAGTGAIDWEAADQCNDGTPQFKLFPTTTTTEAIMKSYTPASGDQIRFATVLNYPGSQKAGIYTTTLIFITTPTF